MEEGAYTPKSFYPVSNAYMRTNVQVGIITGILSLLQAGIQILIVWGRRERGGISGDVFGAVAAAWQRGLGRWI